jgi:hypothetical protein
MTAPRCTEQLWAIEHGKLVCDHSLPCPFHGTTEDQWPSCCGLPMLAYDAKEYRCPDCKRAIPIAPLARAPLTGATVAAICDKHDEALTYLASAPVRAEASQSSNYPEETVMPNTNDDFSQSFNAEPWAAAFVARVRENPSIATDEGTMLTWFANAIMRGYDEHDRQKQGAARTPERAP